MHSYRNSVDKVETTDAAPVVKNIFDKLNSKFFDSKLPEPQILITPNIDEVIHFERNTKFVFNRVSEVTGHFNISVSAFGLSPIDFCAALLHEMVHQWCFINNIKDTSRGFSYHNKKFKREAEAHGLIATQDDNYGFANTIASTELAKWCNTEMPVREADILYYRYQDPELLSKFGNKSNRIDNKNDQHRKYICPVCGDSFRATKVVYMECKKCNAMMVQCFGRYYTNRDATTGAIIAARA